MNLRDKMPLLTLVGPYALALGSGVALVKVWSYIQGYAISEGKRKTVKFAVKGEPDDDDGYVFMDGEGTNIEGREGGEDDYMDLGEDTPQIPYSLPRLEEQEMVRRSVDFYKLMDTRRTVRLISTDHVPLDVVKNVIQTAGTSPSGAHMEPWTFVIVSNSYIKSQLRAIIEEEEEINYQRRMGEKWVNDLAKLRTDSNKPYLEEAPYILVVFKQAYRLTSGGQKQNHYYSEMSTCISVGLLLAALTNVGLTTVTSTPMNSGPKIRTLLNRPSNEKVLLLLPIGYPAKDATVPDLHRKNLNKIMVHI